MVKDGEGWWRLGEVTHGATSTNLHNLHHPPLTCPSQRRYPPRGHRGTDQAPHAAQRDGERCARMLGHETRLECAERGHPDEHEGIERHHPTPQLVGYEGLQHGIRERRRNDHGTSVELRG